MHVIFRGFRKAVPPEDDALSELDENGKKKNSKLIILMV